jgi:hypothetical protein
MFPQLLTRLADAALEVADALLAPYSTGDDAAARVDPPQQTSTPAPHEAPHPHRRALRSLSNAPSAPRRPGAMQRAIQPCTSPLPVHRSGRTPRTSAPARP